MMNMKLYNTLTRTIEEFKPIQEKHVGMYTCGPTVYAYPQIGNWRAFVSEDLLRRTFEYLGYTVTHVMNITDVGHLTGDNLGDADLGEDRMEKAAKKEGKTAWDIAKFYTNDFIHSRELLHIEAPQVLPKATDHIAEQISLVQALFERGLAYKTDKAVYFDVAKFPAYGKLGGQKLIDKRVATRDELVEDDQKHHPFDFALWKLSPTDGPRRQMEWESPWGVGFPGWHIECSAMSMKYLGETFDIHAGGVDHIAIHHANEIAQSEGATGKPFANYWVHIAFLTVDGGRMGKSLGNAYTVQDVITKGFDPLVLRYFYLTGHYRKQLNFTWDALQAAAAALTNLREITWRSQQEKERTVLSEEKLALIDGFRKQFIEALSEDLNIPQALAVVWEVAKSNIPGIDKADLIKEFDAVLGLGLADWHPESFEIPNAVNQLVVERTSVRDEKDWAQADILRKQIQALGFDVQDSATGPIVKKL
jgi:cysteinyl-tRNA synthetase